MGHASTHDFCGDTNIQSIALMWHPEESRSRLTLIHPTDFPQRPQCNSMEGTTVFATNDAGETGYPDRKKEILKDMYCIESIYIEL